MKELLNKDIYRTALEKMQRIHEVGGEPRFEDFRREFGFSTRVKKSLIPNLAGVDLDAEFERLYTEQLAHIRAQIQKANEAARRHGTSYAKLLAENSRLREEIKDLQKQLKR